jgi:uncharacterized protein (TIGR03579 family)
MTNNKSINYQSFWYADWAFPIFTALLAAGTFTACHMYVVHGVGAFNDIAVIALLKAGLDGGGYGAAAAFGASFLFARVLEGPLVGILDIGGSLNTGVGIGIPAILLASGITAPVYNFPLAIITGLFIGLAIGYIIVGIRKVSIKSANSTFGADIMMGAGNMAGRYFGPLIVISACQASLPVGLGSIIGALVFYVWKKPIAGGAILGAMLFGGLFPLPLE